MGKTDETGIEFLRRLAACWGWCREDALDAYTPEELIKMFRAIQASGFDIYPDQLTPEERRYAAKYGKLAAKTCERLNNS